MQEKNQQNNLEFFFRHMERSDWLESVARKKIDHTLSKLHRPAVASKVIFSINGDRQHISVHVHTGNGPDLHCEAEDENMYVAVDLLNTKLDHVLDKYRMKLKKDTINHHLEE